MYLGVARWEKATEEARVEAMAIRLEAITSNKKLLGWRENGEESEKTGMVQMMDIPFTVGPDGDLRDFSSRFCP